MVFFKPSRVWGYDHIYHFPQWAFSRKRLSFKHIDPAPLTMPFESAVTRSSSRTTWFPGLHLRKTQTVSWPKTHVWSTSGGFRKSEVKNTTKSDWLNTWLRQDGGRLHPHAEFPQGYAGFLQRAFQKPYILLQPPCQSHRGPEALQFSPSSLLLKNPWLPLLAQPVLIGLRKPLARARSKAIAWSATVGPWTPCCLSV